MRVLTLLLLCVSLVLAQTNVGSITGTVLDPAGAVIPGAKVTATNVATNVVHNATSTTAGAYTIPALPPGTYNVVAANPGFTPASVKNVEVLTNRTVAMDLTLQVSGTSETVTVTTEAPLVQQAIAAVQYSINQKQIEDLPLPNQSVLRALEMIPGVVGDGGGEQTAPTMGYTMPGTGVSIGGGRMGSTQYKADGVENTSMYMGRISLSFSTDAIQEVQVQQNAFSAEFGRVGSGVVNMTTRSGTNELHGTAFSFIQNDKLNAAPFTNTWRNKGKQRLWRGGVDVGGPIYIPKVYDGRNRSFFFAGFEPLRQSTDTTWYSRVPTELERQGDFSKSIYNATRLEPVTIYRQFEYNQAGTALSTTRIQLQPGQMYPQWEGNKIPERFQSPIGGKLLAIIPMPNYVNPDRTNMTNYTAPMAVNNVDNRWLFKIDQTVTDANRLSFRFASVPTRGKRFYFGGKDSLADMNATDESLGTNIAFSDTHTWGGNKVNEFRLGFLRSNVSRHAPDYQLSKDWFAEYGLPSRLAMGMPDFGVADYEGPVSDYGTYWIDNNYQASNTLNWITGRHSLKIGVEAQMPQQNITDYNNIQGDWSFNRDLTGIGNIDTSTVPWLGGIKGAQTGNGVATLLLGYPSGVNMAPALIPYQYYWKYYAAFVQDDFKLTPKLTLNLGVRYQVEVPRSEKNHNQGSYIDDWATDSRGQRVRGYIQLGGLGGARSTLFPTRYNNFEPRIGFAYRVEGIPYLKAVRAAYGISHVPTNNLFNSPYPDLNPNSDQLAQQGGQDGNWVQLDHNKLVMPANWAPWPEDGKFADLRRIRGIAAMDQNVTIPYMQQWNFGLGFEFGQNYGLELTYVGSKGTNLFGPARRTNLPDLEAYKAQYLSGLDMGFGIENPWGIRDDRGNIIKRSRTDLLRPNPMYGSINYPLAQGYNSNYNSLQAQLIKRYASGLQFNLNYTFSKSIDEISCEGQFCTTNIGSWTTTMPQLYSVDRKLERSVSTYDIPHNIRFSFSYELPFGNGKAFAAGVPGWMNHIVGGWKISGLGSVQSGRPWIAFLGSNAGFPDDVGRIRPNWKPGVTEPIVNEGWENQLNDPTHRYSQMYQVAAMFEAPERFTIGNVPRTLPQFRMPWTQTLNASIMKEFQIHEQTRLAFRAEFFSPFNHVNYIGNVNSMDVFQNLDYQNSSKPAIDAFRNVRTNYTDMTQNIGPTRTIQLGMKLYF